ncbi:hypothetical protein HXA34_13800 [Salipaludibacillus agaradhaerens]|uniref:BsuPI-related putative proteinase inhibitor n=1 Tax=Salipaludibacillus agaradhaerens TaxID=76935 RepID=UPI002151E3C7|nr:BsuPI-related putative proteinase inhibitor [Salipaludibacillus agaradhaerens]MCR6107375.1 hypothetical protein [Salipaludibacillus agaradhaerens]MCR6119404.1 hypothetical protein [Salipaludibacillus agaradhaerens]
MKERSWVIFPLFLLMTASVMAACGQGGNDGTNSEKSQQSEENIESGGNDVIEYEGLSYKTEAEEVNDQLVVRLKLENITEDEKTVTFPSGHQFDVIIKDESGSKLYDFAEGMMFTQALIAEEISPGEELVFEVEWNKSEADFSSLTIETKLNIYEIDNEEVENTPFKLTFKKE